MRPRWMTVTGVLGIIFGCFGMLRAGQVLMMPTVLEWQRKIFTGLKEQAAAQPAPDPFFGQVSMVFEQFLTPPPPWFVPWSIGLGILSLAVAAAYVFGGIWMILMKPAAPRLFCRALIASMIVAILRTIGMTVAIGFMGFAMAAGGIFGVVLDAVLLAVVLAHRREWPAPEAALPGPAI